MVRGLKIVKNTERLLTITKHHLGKRASQGSQIIRHESGEGKAYPQVQFYSRIDSIHLFLVKADEIPCCVKDMPMKGKLMDTAMLEILTLFQCY